MKLILLAWNNKQSNENWIKEVENKLSDLFDETHIQYYNHRRQNKPNIDLEYESKVFIEKINQTDDYVIFAKSVWTILAMKNIYENWLKPKACIFVGVPMWLVLQNQFPYERRLKKNNISILFIQKTSDPTCAYQEIINLLSGLSDKFQFQEIEWNNHSYEDVDLLRKLVEKFLK